MRWMWAMLVMAGVAVFVGQTRPAESQRAVVKPDFADVKYGPHERNVVDVFLAKSDKATPVVVYIHGGGFVGGDKKTLNMGLVRQCVASGISVAAINYRYSTIAPAPAPFADSARAIQFLRSKAKEWNLDKEKFAATGGSAGAGISLWLAFHDDMADAKSEDPVLRESTRLSCAYVMNGQVSYDPRWIKANIPGSGWKHEALPKLFDLKPEEVLNPPAEKAKLMSEFAPIELVKAGCPPVYMMYGMDRSVPAEKDMSASIHHPKFGDLLKEKMDKLGIECTVKVPGDKDIEPPAQFFKRQMKKE